MAEHILFLTGKLAERQLHHVLEAMQPEFRYTVHQLGLKVAGLMTADMIQRRLHDTFGADWVMVPGRCRGDLEALSDALGIRFVRGPDEVKDLPLYFGKARRPPDLSHYDVRIFAEITDAPRMELDAILRQARDYRRDGADVIDLGCLPSTPFPQLEAAVAALHAEGFQVSVDSLDNDDLLRGGKAGADYLLSLHEHNLWIADAVASTPVLIPANHGDLDSLERAMTGLDAKSRAYLVDPILDPIHFGFTASLLRYHSVRSRHPQAAMLMGVGNLTELTHADTLGMNALLLGICSELNISAILTTQVSQHARKAVAEADAARRIMHAAHQLGTLPKHMDDRLLALHETAPFPYSSAEIAELQQEIRDPSFRVQISRDGIHIFNRDGLHSATNPFDLFPKLGVDQDGGHAFYLGVELARAEIAWQLGKRYVQDEPLRWGCAVAPAENTIDTHAYQPAGTTLR
ncbi:MAG: dihydropteroate synthase [Methylococcaceae bacterium]|nr:MAG: dihydropteroate synthase [Methylococcaceae bacterium]